MFIRKTKGPIVIPDEVIAERAYAIWQARGCPEGDGSDDWREAEAQLRQEAEQPQRPLLRLIARIRSRAAM